MCECKFVVRSTNIHLFCCTVESVDSIASRSSRIALTVYLVAVYLEWKQDKTLFLQRNGFSWKSFRWKNIFILLYVGFVATIIMLRWLDRVLDYRETVQKGLSDISVVSIFSRMRKSAVEMRKESQETDIRTERERARKLARLSVPMHKSTTHDPRLRKQTHKFCISLKLRRYFHKSCFVTSATVFLFGFLSEFLQFSGFSFSAWAKII